MNIEKIYPNIKKHINEDLPYISYNENSHTGYIVPQIILDYGDIKSKAKSFPNLAKYMIGSFKELKKSYNSLYNQPKNPKLKISEKDLEALKSFSKTLGINNLGFTKVSPSDIFKNRAIIYHNAIVLTMEMKHSIIEGAPSKKAEKEIFRTYYELNVAVNKIKEYLNQKGYNAVAGPALGGESNYPLLAEKANLGFIGKHGLLITPEFGPSVRLAVVYTDIENLPFATKNDHSWINDFCDKCNNCVRKCPGQAIYQKTKVFEDRSKEHIDYKKCAIPFSINNGCTICVKECVFFNNSYNQIKEAFLFNNKIKAPN
ncbi:MAG: hypothetical protein ACPKM0_09670 [Pleomorphochaeta sp.]